MSAEPTILSPEGELDVHTSRRLGSQLSEAAGDLGRPVVLDLRDVTFIDSSALGVVLRAHERMTNSGRRLPVVVPTEGPVAETLAATGLDRRLQCTSSREEAVAQVSEAPEAA